jgi:hypothetical protein
MLAVRSETLVKSDHQRGYNLIENRQLTKLRLGAAKERQI